MSKKGQGLPLNTIVIASLVIIVLVFLILIFTGRLGTFSNSLDSNSKIICSGAYKSTDKDYTLSEKATCPKTDILVYGKTVTNPANKCCGTPV